MKLFLDYTYKLDCENKINYFNINNIKSNTSDYTNYNFVDITTSDFKQILSVKNINPST